MTTRKRRHRLRQYHRWLGLGLAVPLMLLAVTGILLNHSGDLGLDKRFAAQPWLASLYGIDPEVPDSGYPVAGRWVSHARDTLFLNARELVPSRHAPVGAVTRGELLIVADAETLYLFTRDGRAVDRLPLAAGREPIQGLAIAGRRVLVQTASTVLATDSGVTRWNETDQPWPGSTARQPLPESLRTSIRRHLLTSSLSWERILLELHSGRILGPVGPWLIDLAGVVIVLLAVTGAIMWLRIALRRSQK